MGIERDVEIDRYHRIGPRKIKTSQIWDRPRTVVCRLNRLKDKQRILNNAKKKKKRKTQASLYMRTFQRTPWNLESRYGNKF